MSKRQSSFIPESTTSEVSRNLDNTAYDTVKKVADSLGVITVVGTALTEGNFDLLLNNITEILAVAGITTEIVSIYNDKAVLDSIYADKATLDAIYADLTNIDAVAAGLAEINIVAANITDINSIANNMTDVTYFADIYQGAKASAPALRNDASVLQAGDLYFNTTTNTMYVRTSVATWSDFTVSDIVVDSVQFTGGTGDQGKITWNNDEETLDLIQNGAVLQLGQEIQTHSRNNTGISIANGTVVMASGTLGASGRVTIAPMDGSVRTNSMFMLGITTEVIANDDDGKVTQFGKIRNVDTTGTGVGEVWSEGDVLWVSTSTAGALTNVKPTSGMQLPIAFVINVHATTGTLMVRASSTDQDFYTTEEITTFLSTKADKVPNGEPNGFNHDNTDLMGTISFTDLTRTFTIDVLSGQSEYQFWSDGDLYSYTSAESIQIPDVSGLYIFYFDASGTLQYTTTPDSDTFGKYCVVAYVYWDAINSKRSGFGDERHGIKMDGATHAWIHRYVGAKYLSGMTPDLVDNATDLGVAGVIAGLFQDEDILHTVPQQFTLPIYHLSGTVWVKDTPSTSLSKEYLATGRPAYNFNNGGVHEQADVGISNYCFMHLFATNDIDDPYILIQGQDVYVTKAAAREGVETEISTLVTDGLAVPEFVAIASYILDSNRQIELTDDGSVFIDWRYTIAKSIGGNTNDHSALINRSAADQHPLSAITGIVVNGDGNSYLSNDGTYKTVATGAPVWGDITGTLSSQTDLQNALDAKSDATHTHIINDLTDVDTATTPPTDGQALVYNTTTSKWEAGDVQAGGDVFIDGGNFTSTYTGEPTYDGGSL